MTGTGIVETVRIWARMVKFSHSVFALPFALSGAGLAAAQHGMDWHKLPWIVLAMVGARNAAMGFNRLADQAIDARNPRTRERELPSGKLSRASVYLVTAALTALFVLATYRLQVGWIALPSLFVIFGYSFTKRFTWASHLVLGLALAIAPLGGWLAVNPRLSPVPLLLAAAVWLWVAGFDIVYACQDLEFDRADGLHSIPARFGPAAALNVARILHGGMLAALAAVGLLADLGAFYALGWLAIAALIVRQHRLVRADDLSRLGIAFFNLNGSVSVIYLGTIVVALLFQAA